MARKKLDPKIKYADPENSYRLSDWYLDNAETIAYETGCRVNLLDHTVHRPPKDRLIHSGAWVMITRSIPVSEDLRPIVWGLYWAMPCHESKSGDGFDKNGCYRPEILMKHKTEDRYELVGIYPYEYLVVSEELYNELMESNGYLLQEMNALLEDQPAPMNMELMEKGRALTEDERSIIWAMQVDGLTESQACEEYFLSRHRGTVDNPNIWYCPTQEAIDYFEDIFGWRHDIGTPLKSRRKSKAAEV